MLLDECCADILVTENESVQCRPGYDCPETATYMDINLMGEFGKLLHYKGGICMFEDAMSTTTWRHFDYAISPEYGAGKISHACNAALCQRSCNQAVGKRLESYFALDLICSK